MESQKVWQKSLNLIKNEVTYHNFKTWFGKTILKNLDNKKITIIVPSAFYKHQLISRYERLITETIIKVVGHNLELELVIDSTRFTKKIQEDPEDLPELFQPNHTPKISTINPKYTFENFVVGLTNNLAYAASQAIVQNPGTSYNPLYIYGPSGVGKTHIMQGIGNALLKKNPYLKIIYSPSERFMNDFVESIQTKSTGSFRQKYRSSDILLIDDIQFISGKDSTQEEFFHTFNDLHAKNSQLVFTSDRPPNEIQKLESRLQSRFQGGLMVDIQLPDFDTRIAILKEKLAERGESLPEEILNMVAERVVSNTRELEGKLIQIIQLNRLQGIIPTQESVQKILGENIKPKKNILDHKKVLSEINQYFHTKTSDLTGPRRQKELVLPRQIAMYLMYIECGLPMERVGEILGGRDHTTILHGVRKIEEALQRDREIQRLLIELKQQLSST